MFSIQSVLGSAVLNHYIDEVALNPQPLPPAESAAIGGVGDEVALNPQPLPPREGLLQPITTHSIDDDSCGTGYKRFPIPPHFGGIGPR